MKRRGFLVALIAMPLAFIRRQPWWTGVIKTQINPDLANQFEQQSPVYWLSEGGVMRTEGRELIVVPMDGTPQRYVFDFKTGGYKRV